jgi:hypothetical protein
MEHLRRLFHWFLNGIGLGLGVALIAWCSSKFEARNQSETLSSEVIRITQIEMASLGDTATGAVVLENTTPKKVGVEYDAQLQQGDTILFSCVQGGHWELEPSSKRRIQISCNGIKRESLPTGAKVVVIARKVTTRPWDTN